MSEKEALESTSPTDESIRRDQLEVRFTDSKADEALEYGYRYQFSLPGPCRGVVGGALSI